MTVQYSTLRWNGIGDSTFVGIDNYVTDAHRPGPHRRHRQRVQAHHLLQRRPGPARAARRLAHPARRDRGPGHGVAHRALPAPGHPARRRGHHVDLAAVQERPRQPGPDGDRPGRPHPHLARGLRAGPARGRGHRCLGAPGAVHDPAAHGHEQDRPGAVRVGPHRRRERVAGVPLHHRAVAAIRDRGVHHGHRDRLAGGVRHRVHLDARRARARPRRCPAWRSTASRSTADRSASRPRSRWCSSSSCSSRVLPIQRLTREEPA